MCTYIFKVYFQFLSVLSQEPMDKDNGGGGGLNVGGGGAE